MRILILGRSDALLATGELLSRAGHQICGVITAQASPEFGVSESDFHAFASRLGCPFLLATNLDESAIAMIRSANSELAISSHWISTVGRDVIELFPHGILNSHHGDLPGYRGNAATSWLLIRREPILHLNVLYMLPNELDAGDILVRREFKLTDSTTIKDIFALVDANIPGMFLDAVAMIAEGRTIPLRQADLRRKPFRCYPRIPRYSKIDWTAPATDVDALIRASTRPYPGAYTYVASDTGLRKLYVWASRIVSYEHDDLGVPGHVLRNDSTSGESWVMTGKGILALTLVQYEGSLAFQPGKEWKSIRQSFVIDVEGELIALEERLRRIP